MIKLFRTNPRRIWIAVVLGGALISACDLSEEGEEPPEEWRKLLTPDDDDGGEFGDEGSEPSETGDTGDDLPLWPIKPEPACVPLSNIRVPKPCRPPPPQKP